jgi:TolB-like protein
MLQNGSVANAGSPASAESSPGRSVQAHRGEDVREIAQLLGVDYLLEGSVRRAGERVRVSAQLVDGADGCHLWSDRYERLVSDPFAVQDELTGLIVAGLARHLQPRRTPAHA